MRYRIAYDQPGRLRVRFGPDAFTQEQGYGIAALLLGRPGVREAVTCALNGSVLVCYEGEGRAEALAVLRGLRRDALPVGTAADDDQLRQVDSLFLGRLLSMAARHFLKKWFLPFPVRCAVTLWNAAGYWREGLRSLGGGRLDVAVLDAASIAGAIARREWSTAGSVMFLLGLSALLEDYTRKRTQTTLTQSLAIHVDTVWRVAEDGSEESIPMGRLALGERIRVRSGALIPVDGTVTDGDAMVNEASMTGEPLPVHKRQGSTVYAGTVLEEGSLVIQAAALAGESRIQQIVGLIENSEALKAGAQSQAERLADAIVPFSFAGALAVGLLTRNVTRALSVLMVDYSCAIKLSTPISIISAMREASARRIMVKGGKYLEAFAEADTIVFDKTGTLTAACPGWRRFWTSPAGGRTSCCGARPASRSTSPTAWPGPSPAPPRSGASTTRSATPRWSMWWPTAWPPPWRGSGPSSAAATSSSRTRALPVPTNRLGGSPRPPAAVRCSIWPSAAGWPACC